ncbi:T9SS type A sorting domain-containing protein [Hymenobacter sp. ASUV-10]|uniref:T9SS type A sorting domain-containing protein n=1 Tax=Hymenobacter aranciens TaxID=3063996 RepID=A0ABT9BFA0_9BACT|nr:T9SS type A sorting domain-containing protein [Hymenobacter sp. ASUV-10]MDO7876369.1 T9SS type A sorting domain-containing protein [Hymenobacter sp. ASUV-10]
MKLRLLLAAAGGLLGATQASHAQTAAWCPPGATWHYEVQTLGGSFPVTLRYAGDTLVGGHQAQRLRYSDSSMPTKYVRVSNDSLYSWHNGRYVLLYRFDARPGDSWQTYAGHAYGICPQAPVTLTVDNVGTQVIGGRPLRWLSVRVSAPSQGGVLRIYDSIGSINGWHPYAPTCGGTDPDYLYLRSFEAPNWPTVGVGVGTTGQLQVLATAEARAAQASFTAYPNPTTGLLTLEIAAPPAAAQVVVRDLTGRQLRRQALSASRQLDLRGLPSGSYLLTLESAGQPALTRRITVQ